MRTILVLLTAVAMLTGGCIGSEAEGGTKDEAIGLAEEFLSAVKAHCSFTGPLARAPQLDEG